MRELYALVFSVCVVLIGTEMIVRLFPEKSGSLIHALAALMLLVVLVNGILKLQSGASLDFDLTETGEAESTITQSYAEKGTAILKERLSALLKSAGMDVPVANIDIWYTQDDDGVVTVERVRVRVRFATDIDRADALLRSVLTEAIPVDVYV
ncbi:MAG: hypothetical protein PUK20_09840 [Firmicutes bacterium]|uniref:hypothetical protein n=1 Tax=Neglectibacter sp. CSJ-5 TaxID=3078043 RepID=UPI0029304184|nr:hypothetical protein [Neglectibacter sp. CSJ-5]MDD7635194.1 hypothetical protein [Bacillota bacterium]MDY4107257.1 hypothetical protein [Oscillospiraceae bacterium]